MRERDDALVVRMRQLTDAYMDAALLQREKGDMGEMVKSVAKAEEVCRECMRILPHLSEPHARLGRLYRAAMRMDDARVELDRAIEKDPRDLMARFERGLLRATEHRELVADIIDAFIRKAGGRVAEMGREVRDEPTAATLEARDPVVRRLKLGALEDLEAAGVASRRRERRSCS